MSDDWQPGDLALCVKVGRWEIVRPGNCPSMNLRAGQILTVDGVKVDIGVSFLHFTLGRGWYAACCFRKIRPHIPDEEDAETIRLLTGTPVLEPQRHRLRHPQNEAEHG